MWNAPSRPSPRCGRLDDHLPHVWHRQAATTVGRVDLVAHHCPGHTVTEGGQPCVECSRPVAACRCAAERAAERGEEWDS